MLKLHINKRCFFANVEHNTTFLCRLLSCRGILYSHVGRVDSPSFTSLVIDYPINNGLTYSMTLKECNKTIVSSSCA